MIKVSNSFIQDRIKAGYDDARFYSSRIKEMVEAFENDMADAGMLILAMKTAANILKLKIDTQFAKTEMFDEDYMAIVSYNNILRTYYNKIANHIMEVYYKS